MSNTEATLPLELEVLPEEIPGPPDTELMPGDETFGEPLDIIHTRALAARVDSLEHQLLERKDLHALRKQHARRLFCLTVVWVGVVWFVVLMQGFERWFLPMLDGFVALPFSLTNTVAVAFITSTTATVLGLYGIAAYWLSGKAE